MKLVTYRASVEAAAKLGVLVDDLVVDVAALGAAQGARLPDTMLGLIDAGRPGLETLRACLDAAGGRFPAGTATALANVKLLAPIPRPRKNIFGIGLNYVEHVAESAKSLDTAKELPKQPVIFSKPPTAVIGPGFETVFNPPAAWMFKTLPSGSPASVPVTAMSTSVVRFTAPRVGCSVICFAPQLMLVSVAWALAALSVIGAS